MDKNKINIKDYLLGKWFLDETTEEERLEVEEWSSKSEENQKVIKDSNKILKDIEYLKVMESISSINAINKVKKRITNSNHPMKKIFGYWQKVAAIIVLPLLLYSLYQASNNYFIPKEAISWNEMSTPVGMQSKFQLPDGTEVWLNGNTKIKYPIEFKGKERLVELDGEAYFDVVSNKKVPFLVKANNLLIQAVGTSFNVRAYSNDSKCETALLEGKVNVIKESVKGRRVIASLEPGQLDIYNTKTKENKIYQGNLDKYIAWRDGKILFRNDNLGEVLIRLGQWYNVDFQVSDDLKAEYVYTGTFQGESLHQILQYIELTTPIKFSFSKPQQNQDGTYIKRTIQVLKK